MLGRFWLRETTGFTAEFIGLHPYYTCSVSLGAAYTDELNQHLQRYRYPHTYAHTYTDITPLTDIHINTDITLTGT